MGYQNQKHWRPLNSCSPPQRRGNELQRHLVAISGVHKILSDIFSVTSYLPRQLISKRIVFIWFIVTLDHPFWQIYLYFYLFYGFYHRDIFISEIFLVILLLKFQNLEATYTDSTGLHCFPNFLCIGTQNKGLWRRKIGLVMLHILTVT